MGSNPDRSPHPARRGHINGDDRRLHTAPSTFSAEAEADRWLAPAAADLSRGDWVDPEAGKNKLRDFADHWMAGKAALAPKTVDLYRYLLDRLILPPLGDVALGAITPARVRIWRADMLRAGRPGESTIAKAYRLPSGILGTAVIDNAITRNPCREKGAGVERATEIRAATPAEVSALAAAREPRYRALVLTRALQPNRTIPNESASTDIRALSQLPKPVDL
jgi:hypothetical protein